MEIVIVVLLLLIIAALAFAWMKFRPGAPGRPGGVRGAGGIRGPRRTAVASRHDPMAEAVERHARATDPHEAAQEELRLQAQANRVASDLHSRQAASLDAEAGSVGRGHAVPAQDYEQPAYADSRPVYEDEDGRPVSEDGRPVNEDGRPVYEDGRPVHRDDPPRY